VSVRKSVTTAIVLCAGRGKRLSPHTDTTPKPLLPVGNKPTLDFILNSLQHAGIKRVVLVTHYLSEQLTAYAKHQTYFPQGSVRCVRQEQLAGTADALDAFEQSQKAIAVSLKRIDVSELAMRSSVRFDDNGDVLEIVEKPVAGTAPSQLSANLIYVLPADIVEAVHQVKPSPRGEKEIQSAVNSYLQQHGPGFSLEQLAPQEWQPGM